MNLILSPSGINLYMSCPYSFKLRYIDHKKPIITDDSALKLGKSVHSVLENFYVYVSKDSKNPDIDLIAAMKMSAKDFWDRSIDARKRDEMNTHMFLWLQFEIQRYKKYKELNIIDRFFPISIEEDITDYENRLRSIIDKRCIGVAGNMYALDYKTDKKLPAQRNFSGNLKQIDDKYKIQSALNALVLKSQGEKLDNFFFQFVRYPDKLLSVPLTHELFKEVNEIIKKIRETTEFEKNLKSCFYCSLKLYCRGENTSIHCLTNNDV